MSYKHKAQIFVVIVAAVVFAFYFECDTRQKCDINSLYTSQPKRLHIYIN